MTATGTVTVRWSKSLKVKNTWSLIVNFMRPTAILDQNENDALKANLRRYLLDRVDTAIPTPHAAEQNLAFFGTKAGTGLGEAVRFMMQFKTFPITFILRPLKAATIDNIPLIERQGNWKDVINAFKHAGTFSQATQLFVGASALGYISICANQWLKGEDMPELNQKTIEAAMLKGGGLGLFWGFSISRLFPIRSAISPRNSRSHYQ